LAKRRSKGEGTVYQRPDGLWVAQITLPDKRRITKYAKSQREVRDWLFLKRKELAEGTFANDERMTVNVFIDKWFELVKPRLRISTQTVHEVMIRLHIKPTIGYIRLSQLTPVTLQHLYADKLKEGLSNRSVKYIHTIIHQMLSQALKWGLVNRNVSEAVDAPIPIQKPVEPLTQTQVQRLLGALKDDRLYSFYVVALGCGLRRGELLALTWDCVDLDNGLLYVKKSLQAQKGKGLVSGEPKSPSSRRTIAMPDFVKNALASKEKVVESPYVFCTSKGTPFSPRNIVRHFKSVLKKANLPQTIRLHDLRHTFVSYMLSQNVPVKDVQVIAGHADFSTTMDIYGHLMPGAQKEAAKKMDGLFNA
jgi:integrase